MKKILILTALVTVAFGCNRSNVATNSQPANAPAANSQTNAPAANTATEPVKEEVYTKGADPRADIISAAQKRQKLPFWTAKVTSNENSSLSAEMKYAAPDSYYFR